MNTRTCDGCERVHSSEQPMLEVTKTGGIEVVFGFPGEMGFGRPPWHACDFTCLEVLAGKINAAARGSREAS